MPYLCPSLKKVCSCEPFCSSSCCLLRRLDWNTGCWLVAFTWCTIWWLLAQRDEQNETHAAFLFMVMHHYIFGTGPLHHYHLSFITKNNYATKKSSLDTTVCPSSCNRKKLKILWEVKNIQIFFHIEGSKRFVFKRGFHIWSQNWSWIILGAASPCSPPPGSATGPTTASHPRWICGKLGFLRGVGAKISLDGG